MAEVKIKKLNIGDKSSSYQLSEIKEGRKSFSGFTSPRGGKKRGFLWDQKSNKFFETDDKFIETPVTLEYLISIIGEKEVEKLKSSPGRISIFRYN